MAELSYRAKSSAWDLLAARFGRERPIAAMFEIADRCNESCVHCYQIHGEKGELSTEEVFRALDQLAELGILFVTFSGGEATLRPDFLEIVAYARQLKFAVKLYSNGLRIDEAMADALAELAVQEVQLSLYSVQPDIHDAVTKVPGSWEKTVRAATLLRDRSVGVTIKTPLMKYNHDEVRDYAALAASLGVEFAIDPSGLMPRENGSATPHEHNAGFGDLLDARRELDALEGEARARYAESSDRSDKGRIAAVRAALAEPRRERPARTELAPPRREGAPCGACANAIHIEPNGEVRPCAQLGVALGNSREEGIEASWRGATSASIRGLRWTDIVGCRVCDLQPYCGRCHHASRAATGDALVPYVDACATARRTAAQRLGGPLEVRGAEIGPYRHLGDRVFETFEDELGPADEALRREHPWMRASAPPRPRGELVQLRVHGKAREDY